MIQLKPFKETPGLCGPASLKMVLDYYGIMVGEAELAKIVGATPEKGTSIDGLIKGARHFGFQAFFKYGSTVSDLRYFVKRDIPPIVDWFSEDDGHYSVVVNVTDKDIILMDPALRKILVYARKRKMPIEKFQRIWFDFPGSYLKSQSDLILRLMLVATPFKEKFPIEGGEIV